MTAKVQTILDELGQVFRDTSVEHEQQFVQELVRSRRVVCVGAGRVGLALAGFAKRLRHLGKDAFWIEDATLPRTGAGDLMVIGSGSGETESIVTLANLGKREGLDIALLTATTHSRLAAVADVSVVLNCPSKTANDTVVNSVQPMTTLFEQAAQLYLDAIVLELMEELNVSDADMRGRHNGIE
jgi:6-phospho-3-hexuloisomerase